MKKDKKPSKPWWAGYFYISLVVSISVVLVIVSMLGFLPWGECSVKWPFWIVGTLFMILAIWLLYASYFSGPEEIKEIKHELITDGVWASVRNPIYSAVMFFSTGVLLLCSNYFLIIPFFLFWIIETLIVANTEEKYLIGEYGDEYLEYKKMVNRCIPWFPKKKLKLINITKREKKKILKERLYAESIDERESEEDLKKSIKRGDVEREERDLENIEHDKEREEETQEEIESEK